MAKKRNKNEQGNGVMRLLMSSIFVPDSSEKVDTRLKIVKWGKNNDYGQILASFGQDNAIHGGILQKKITFISAGGLDVVGEDRSILENYAGEYSLEDIQVNLVNDQEYFNGFALIFRLGEDGNYFAEHVDFEKVRCTEDNVFFAVNDNWSDYSSETIFYKNLEYYDDDELVDEDGVEIYIPDNIEEDAFILYVKSQAKQVVKDKKFSTNYYPVPSYSSAITSILALNNMARFSLSETENNFSSGLHIALKNGVPESEEEANEIRLKYSTMLKDKDKQGGAFISFSNGEDDKTDITTMNGNNLADRYNNAKKVCREEIIIAHQVSEALFGIKEGGLFGSKEELEIAFNIFKTTYAKQKQDNICNALEWAFNVLNDWDGEFFYTDYKLNVDGADSDNEVLNKLNQLEDDVKGKILENMTPNQLLSLIDLPPIEGGDVLREKAPIAFKMSEDKDLEETILKHFEKSGRSKELFKFVEKKSKFASGLSNLHATILQMVGEGESFDAIKKALEISTKQLSKHIVELGAMGYLDGLELTEKGKTEPSEVIDVETVYSYEVKPNVPPAKSGSRNFCARMMALNKVYTREEIDAISNLMGIDVWRYRGGWYHNPKTDRTTPSCRHEWEQHSVIKIK